MRNWMIYGANGYTGNLVAREAIKRGHKPILAGRNRERMQALAAELGLDHRVFALEDPNQVAEHIRGMRLVLHCAGPFSTTSAIMIEACLMAGAHYLDISGEISVFEHAHAQNERAQKANIVICPGVGFDVIPTDCLAANLKQALPDATHLALGFDSRSGFSPGTAKTSVEGLAQGGKIRRDGKIVRTPLAWSVRRIDFGDGEKLAMGIPWGDVSTAFYSTGIPNIEVYIPGSPRMIRNAKRINVIRWLLGFKPVQKFLQKKAAQSRGPDLQAREQMPTFVWGEAKNAAGTVKTARIKTANGYSLTATGSLAVTEFLLGNEVQAGSYTPSLLCGADLVEKLPGSGRIIFAQ